MPCSSRFSGVYKRKGSKGPNRNNGSAVWGRVAGNSAISSERQKT